MHLTGEVWQDSITYKSTVNVINSDVATGGSWSWGQSATPDNEKFAKNGEKEGKKRKNREGSFTLSLLTDKAGYATSY